MKVMGIAVAVEKGYINSLITDVYTAQKLIDIFGKKEMKNV